MRTGTKLASKNSRAAAPFNGPALIARAQTCSNATRTGRESPAAGGVGAAGAAACACAAARASCDCSARNAAARTMERQLADKVA